MLMYLNDARAIAGEILAALAPACERIEIASSIRRQKPDGIKDVEIVAVSKPFRPVFGQKPSLGKLQALTDRLRSDGVMLARTNEKGRVAWGQKYRRALWGPRAVPLDLFIVQREAWGAQFTLRTGDADFSHKLVTPRSQGGAMPDNLVLHDGRLWRSGVALHTPDELDFFRALNLVWIEPRNRSVQALQRYLRQEVQHA